MVKHTETIRRLLPMKCLSVFDHFVGLTLKVLNLLHIRFCSLFDISSINWEHQHRRDNRITQNALC